MSSVSIRARAVSDGSRRFDVRYRRGGRYFPVEHAGTFRTKGEAEIRRALVGEWLAAGLDPKVELTRVVAPAQSVEEAQAAWFASRRRVAPSTLRTYGYHCKRIAGDLGERAIAALTVADVIAWVGELERDYAPGTVRIYVGQLRMILDFAGVPNVARDRRVEIPRDRREEPDPPDAQTIVDALGRIERQHRLPVVAMERLGSRISETLALRPDDVDADRMRVRFRREESKQGRGRFVETDEFLVQALMERLPFAGTRTTVGSALAEASDKSVHPHALRHRRASLWHQAGVDPVELARRLGHARPSVSLDVYAHVRPLKEIPDHELVDLLR